MLFKMWNWVTCTCACLVWSYLESAASASTYVDCIGCAGVDIESRFSCELAASNWSQRLQGKFVFHSPYVRRCGRVICQSVSKGCVMETLPAPSTPVWAPVPPWTAGQHGALGQSCMRRTRPLCFAHRGHCRKTDVRDDQKELLTRCFSHQ